VEPYSTGPEASRPGQSRLGGNTHEEAVRCRCAVQRDGRGSPEREGGWITATAPAWLQRHAVELPPEVGKKRREGSSRPPASLRKQFQKFSFGEFTRGLGFFTPQVILKAFVFRHILWLLACDSPLCQGEES
jgi:hypothetical protein